jgi:cell division protein FtsB
MEKKYLYIIIGMFFILFLETCATNRKVSSLEEKIDSLSNKTVTKKDLLIEGLKSEKRMIQSTNRRILDVERENKIEEELKKYGQNN